MRKARNYWKETCAILAMLVGLGLAGMSWGNGPYVWPANQGGTQTTYKCNSSTSLWDCTNNFMQGVGCVKKGSPGKPGNNNSLYECGNTIWNSVQVTQIRQYGQCNSGSGSCTEWTQYWCVAWNVYEDNACSTLACSPQGWGSNFCDPNNP